MASTDVLSQTLNSITGIKLEEISTQQTEFESTKAEILRAVSTESDQAEKVRVLLEGVRRLTLSGKLNESRSVPLKNIEHFLQQACHDPSVTAKILNDWQCKLEKQLDISSLKYDYATLYSHLVKEWLNANENNDAFENIGRAEMHEQRVKWEDLVFTAKKTDVSAIHKYLHDLFTSTEETKVATETLWKATENFEMNFSNMHHFDEETLTSVIKGLLRSDLVTDEKSQVLRDFLNNKIVLAEVADVLNMRIRSFEKWCWNPSGINVEQRRNLNGRYRFYADEDLLQTILLRYLGLVWSIFLKETLTNFRNAAGVWTPPAERIPTLDSKRQKYFLQTREGMTVEALRAKHFEYEIFLEQLADSLSEERGGYDDDTVKETDSRQSGAQITQKLLHTLVTEINILTRLGQDVCVVRSDFAWFGPSMPHSTIFAVLKFFRVSDQWLEFFRRAIEAPVKFGVDGKDAPVRTRKRGTPVSGPLSDFLGEAVLFCLDFGFNSYTSGLPLYRLHDDIWFWGDEKKCIKGWSMMKEFSNLMGLEFSEEKTGCTKINRTRSGSAVTSSSLPKGPVRWGFLKLESEGIFTIDQNKVDVHITELRRQLDNCKSILDWIQAWNVYGVRFFTTNFGKAANCFGLQHVDMLLETFARIQAKLFSSTGGSVTSTLKGMITERFGVHDIPEGYLFWPANLGGLDLKSPFINLYLIRDSILKNPNERMDRFFIDEESEYKASKTRFEEDPAAFYPNSLHADKSWDTFMPFEEYTRYRLQASTQLYTTYCQLMETPQEIRLTGTSQSRIYEASGDRTSLSAYQRWIVELYASDMSSRFGGLNVVEKGLLPTGLVSMFRESRFKWSG